MSTDPKPSHPSAQILPFTVAAVVARQFYYARRRTGKHTTDRLVRLVLVSARERRRAARAASVGAEIIDFAQACAVLAELRS